MLSLSLKSLFCYWQNDYTQMSILAHKSVNKGSYFFNNYLLCKSAQETHQADSLNYYLERFVKEKYGRVDSLIYSDLLLAHKK